MITAKHAFEKANKALPLISHIQRNKISRLIRKAASHGEYSLEIPYMNEENIKYFKEQGFEIKWKNSIFLLAAGNWVISWSENKC